MCNITLHINVANSQDVINLSYWEAAKHTLHIFKCLNSVMDLLHHTHC